MATAPCKKNKLTITQYKHNSVVNGKTYYQDAIDVSPRGFSDWRIYAFQLGTVDGISKADKKKKTDASFQLKLKKSGVRLVYVHSEVNDGISNGFYSKEGGRIGEIAKTNPSGAPAHIHLFGLKIDGKPIDVIQFFIDNNIYPNEWLLDPMGLIPKGKYVMSRPVVPTFGEADVDKWLKDHGMLKMTDDEYKALINTKDRFGQIKTIVNA